MRRPCAIGFALAAGVGCHSAPATVPHPSPGADPAILSGFLAQVVAQDSALDFRGYRLTYATTSLYAPYGSRDTELRKAIYAALDNNEFAAARALADSFFVSNPVDAEAHLLAAYAAAQGPDSPYVALHGWIADGLFRSIAVSGAGTEASPFVVISVDEEYQFARSLGLKPGGAQGLGECGAVACDWVEFTSLQSGRDTTLFFDVTIPLAHLDGKFAR